MQHTSDLKLLATMARAIGKLAEKHPSMTLEAGLPALQKALGLAAYEASGPGTIEQAAQKAVSAKPVTDLLPPWE